MVPIAPVSWMAELVFMMPESAEPDAHAWMNALSPADREACLRDLSAAAGTERMADELRAWRETATAVAAGLGRSELEWLDEDQAVERP